MDDRYNTSHDFAVKCTFASGIEMIVTSRGDNGILFEGDKGRIFVNRGKITGKPIEENWDEGQFTDEDVVRLYKGKPLEGHKDNFYRCIREGGLPVSDVVQPRADDEHLPPGRDRRPARPHDQVGSPSREDRRRRPGRRVLRPRAA